MSPGTAANKQSAQQSHVTLATNALYRLNKETSPTLDTWKPAVTAPTNTHGLEIPRALASLVVTITTIKAKSRFQMRKVKVKTKNKP